MIFHQAPNKLKIRSWDFRPDLAQDEMSHNEIVGGVEREGVFLPEEEEENLDTTEDLTQEIGTILNQTPQGIGMTTETNDGRTVRTTAERHQIRTPIRMVTTTAKTKNATSTTHTDTGVTTSKKAIKETKNTKKGETDGESKTN